MLTCSEKLKKASEQKVYTQSNYFKARQKRSIPTIHDKLWIQ